MTKEVFEVEKIVGHKITKSRIFVIYYEIKWAGYSTVHNTVEKETNVFATNMVIKYWSGFAPDHPERVLFEKIQSRRKNPITLPAPKPSKKAPVKKPEPKRLPEVIANDTTSDEEEEDADELTNKSNTKRKGQYFSDYFLEEHERKKQKESVELPDHNIDWDSLAESVEYIGKESPEDAQYQCRVKWKDGVRTMHALSLVRTKRPDLVIDRFILMTEANK